MFDPSNKNTAYVGLGGYMGSTTSANSHVWKISNLGSAPTITAINNGLPDVPVNAFAVDPANGNNLYVGTDIGVYGSTDGGATWAPFARVFRGRCSTHSAHFQRTANRHPRARHGINPDGATALAGLISCVIGAPPGTRTGRFK
jgi:hypothetical protein